jgi:hypothetical protein
MHPRHWPLVDWLYNETFCHDERYGHWLSVTSHRPDTVWSDFEHVEEHSFVTQRFQQQ